MDERSIFMTALEQEIGTKRSAFLDDACANDPALRQRVEALLQSHAEAGTFLGTPVAERLAEQLRVSPGTEEGASDEPPSDDDLSLEFLTPSDKPGSLGRLGHYEIQQAIGRGGMGIVLRAFDEKLHRVVAIKVMAPQLATSAAARKRFTREAQAAAAVSHDHVVTIHAVEEAGGMPYLAMQYVSGMSLQERLDKSGPLELREIVRIGMQTAAGLAAAHAQGLIHRDIKPANILLENGVERVKITDFGLARAVADVSMTQTGMVAGTPQYMSPEQARGEMLDPRSDLFSLGSVLYAMCTSRPPFQAETTVATARLVCEDTPRPIRELNTDIPEWLTKIIDRLLAKQPAKRFQSAAEVAELLGRHLAQVQHPSLVGQGSTLPVHRMAGWKRAPRRHLWATAAAVLLCIAAGLGLAEATGTTKLASTVIRIFTPSGTLVVEMTDPGAKLTVEGDGGLIITGGGLHEVRLKPGSYKLQAAKNGQPVPLEREVVRIATGGREVVRVKMETTPATAIAKVEPGAFVLLGSKGIAERKFDTLAEAVQAASDGDTIEVRGNGPFLSRPINIQRAALTIRAGAGFRPVIKLSPEVIEEVPLFATDAALVLEGLEFQAPSPEAHTSRRDLAVMTYQAPLRAANCRFRAFISADRSPACEFRNCEFLAGEAFSPFNGRHRSGARIVFENCLFRTEGAAINLEYDFDDAALHDVSFQITRSTLVWKFTPLWLMLHCPLPARSDESQALNPIRLDISRSIFDAIGVLGFEQHKSFVDKAGAVAPAEAEALLLRLLQWRGERNVLPAGSTPLVWSVDGKQQPAHGPNSLETWKRFWGSSETNSLEGRSRFQGGNLIARTDLDQLTPDDFRLRPDSAGYRAGPDGKDLGANVDLVGPGPAYERWKKTTEYQEWLKETGQLKELAAARPDTGAFVLQGGAGVAERKFDTLAEAVQGASDGDTIEIRGNGPFVSGPINIQRSALTIRAGEGFRPVIKLSPAGVQRGSPLLFLTNGTLTLEGLELHDAPTDDDNHKRVIQVNGAVLRAANCRFRSSIWTYSTPGCVFLNCEFLSDVVGEFLGQYSPGARFIHENCLYRGGGAALYFSSAGSASDEVSVQIKRSTFVNKRVSVWLAVKSPPAAQPDQPPASKPVRLEVSGCIFDTPSVLGFEQHKDFVAKAGAHAPAAAEALLLRLMEWRGERNVLPAGSTSVVWGIEGRRQAAHGPQSLEEWQQFWGAAEADPLEGRLHFQDGDLRNRTESSLDQLTAEDFRLQPDSAGYRAGPDGNDLGADVDLVGPGPAYERWKKTPEYQEWLKDTGQLRAAAPKAEPKAFVLLGGNGVAERRFDTLAEAVQSASDGDTIEVRGNGPFVTRPVTIGNWALVIRAAAGYRPVIRLSEEDTQSSALLHSRGRLTVEGLEFQRLGQSGKPGPSRRYILFSATRSSLHVANCRFRADNPDPKYRLVCIGAHGTACCLRNCEFLAPIERTNSINTSSKSFVLDNCLHLGRIALSLVFEQIESGAEFVVSRNTLVTDIQAIFFGVGIEPEQLASGPVAKPIGLVATGNIFDVGRVLGLNEMHSRPQPLELNEAESIFRRVLDWQGRENVYRPGGRFLLNWGCGENGQPDHGPQDLEDWKQFWSSPETGSLEGRVRYQGGDLLARLADTPETLTPDDFRLRADSPGYRAGPDGKDLGADVDLVGPGPAYERWKNTPEYQDWLKETGQMR